MSCRHSLPLSCRALNSGRLDLNANLLPLERFQAKKQREILLWEVVAEKTAMAKGAREESVIPGLGPLSNCGGLLVSGLASLQKVAESVGRDSAGLQLRHRRARRQAETPA